MWFLSLAKISNRLVFTIQKPIFAEIKADLPMKRPFIAAVLAFICACASAQDVIERPIIQYAPGDGFVAKEDFSIPDVLVRDNGRKVRNRRQWEKKRRPELMGIFESEMFGEVPSRPEGLRFELTCPDSLVYGGTAIRRRVRIYLDAAGEHHFDMMIHLPAKHEGRIPMFVGLNFRELEENLTVHRHTWPFEYITAEGFGVAVAFHTAIEPDGPEGEGYESANVRSWYKPAGEWGAISAWAWGISRMIDYFETCPEIDMQRIAVIGHSRLGKTALWASANDRRISLAVSNNSGCCGAALSRRMYGETFQVIQSRFPYWFVPKFEEYAGREDSFPTDQHALIALSAPRPVYVASADEDDWADPIGEWQAALLAGPVYRLYGLQGLSGDHMPADNHTDDYGSVAYKIRTGIHALWPDDWCDYIKFAKRHFYPCR